MSSSTICAIEDSSGRSRRSTSVTAADRGEHRRVLDADHTGADHISLTPTPPAQRHVPARRNGGSLAVTESAPLRAVLNLESGKRLVADAVLFSAGRLAATESLNLAAAGLSAGDRGRLKVDEAFRTTVPHIFAAVTSSLSESRVHVLGAGPVGRMPGLRNRSATDGPPFPIGIYAIPEISMVGPPEHELTAARVPYETASRGIARSREARSSATRAASSRCSFTARIGGCSPCTAWEPEPRSWFMSARPSWPSAAG